MSRNGIFVFFGLVAMTACSAGAATTDTSSTAEALTEANASAEDAKATADACLTTYDTCIKADGADVAACRAALKECLPGEAHPGPRCGPHRGKGKGNPHGPNGGACDRDGGADGDHADGDRPPPPPEGSAAPAGSAPPPPPDGDRPEGGKGGKGGKGEGGKGGEPGFCKKVPLPAPAEVQACRDALDTCIAGAADDAAKTVCRDAHHACVKAAFDDAKAALESEAAAQ